MSPSPGCGARPGGAPTPPTREQVEHPAHLVERLAAGRGHRLEDRARRVGGTEGGADAARLDDEQADVVGDDVVELAGDAHPLLGDRPPGEQVALALQVQVALPQRLHVGAAGGEVQPQAVAPPMTAARATPVAMPTSPWAMAAEATSDTAATAAAVLARRQLRLSATV